MDKEIESFIETARIFERSPETDFGETPTWIAMCYRNDFVKWARTSELYLMNKYKSHKLVNDFSRAFADDKNTYQLTTLRALVGILEAFNKIDIQTESDKNADDILQTIFGHFHQCATQLKRRHNNRETIKINDEYDVQDLLHALFKIHFDDVRPEEWCPSYAGGSKRMDFLLKGENIAIEVKKTREGLQDKEIGEQLIVDIANYKNHSDVHSLYCFVYDPDVLITNPYGLEKDLSQTSEELTVKVFIRPQ